MYTNMAEKGQEEFLVPKNLTEAKELVNKLGINDLRTFCFTFALGQEGLKASVKKHFHDICHDTDPMAPESD